MDFDKHVEELKYAYGEPSGKGLLREKAEHFCVDEELTFQPSGDGEHAFLYIQKKNLNTDDVVKVLSRHADVPRRNVSYAGMKDRKAITKQWFSVHLPGKEGPDWHGLNDEQIKIDVSTRHKKKLKRGVIKFNHFDIVISNVAIGKIDLEQRVDTIKSLGVPNYFMEQRFGYKCQNLSRAYDCFSRDEVIRNRKLKGLFLSSVRSFLFNKVLSQRVSDNTWDKAMDGDFFMLNGTRQCFHEEAISDDIRSRVIENDIHPTGPLFGEGSNTNKSYASNIEQNVFLTHKVFCDGLLKEKMESSRRALRVVPRNFKSSLLADDKLRITFALPSGSYATAVIRELIQTTDNRGN